MSMAGARASDRHVHDYNMCMYMRMYMHAWRMQGTKLWRSFSYLYRKQTPSSKGDKSAVRKIQVPPSSAPRRLSDAQWAGTSRRRRAGSVCPRPRCKAGLCEGAADSCPQEPKCERSKVQAPRMSLADILRERREKRELVLQ
jgi:hypothetical protein